MRTFLSGHRTRSSSSIIASTEWNMITRWVSMMTVHGIDVNDEVNRRMSSLRRTGVSDPRTLAFAVQELTHSSAVVVLFFLWLTTTSNIMFKVSVKFKVLCDGVSVVDDCQSATCCQCATCSFACFLTFRRAAIWHIMQTGSKLRLMESCRRRMSWPQHGKSWSSQADG